MNESNMILANRDLILYKIKQKIKEKKILLIQKTKDLEKKKYINHFLEGIKKDYQTYHDFIINEKNQQYEAMKIINEYLDNLMKTENITNHEMKKAKYDQKVILTEIEKIKTELDELVSV